MLTLVKDQTATAEIEVKRSKFLSLLTRVDDEPSAREVINEVRRTYPDARHHCSAFVLFNEDGPNRMHSSDDGEPSGTAGPPMLDTLVSAGLSDVVAVVTRYFGGTLLGTGGLVRAYSEATSAAIENAQIVEVKNLDLVQVTVPLDIAGRLDAEIRNAGFSVQEADWGYELRLSVALGEDDQEALRDLVASATRATPQIESMGSVRHEVRHRSRT